MLLASSVIWDLLSTLRTDDENNQRIGKASTNFGRLSSRVWKNHHLAIKLKIKVYTACILSVLLYSNETWSTYRRQKKRLNAFHFRCLRSILGVSEGSCPQLHHPASHRFIWPHYYHKAATSALAMPRPPYGRWSPAQGYPLQRIL